MGVCQSGGAQECVEGDRLRMFQTAASSFENQVPLELQGALAVSLPALAVSKGLSDVRLWGILETAGPEGTRDYVIAQGVKRGV